VTQPVEYMSVGERIAIYRRRRGLSQLALANMIGRSAKTLTKVGETELAWIAAERSLPAAEHAEFPLLMAASAYHLGHAFRRAG
jgi:DNA-binding XRE family transcriptional regulator